MFLALGTIVAANSATAPDWVRAASATPVRTYPDDTPAIVLLDETVVDVAPDGTRTQRDRIVLRILSRAGRSWATAETYFHSSSDKLQSFRAWVVLPSGKVNEFKKKDVVERAVFTTGRLELYGELKSALIDATDQVVPGSVFAFEAIKTERGVFSQDRFRFQWDIPVETSTYTANVPQEWRVEGRVFNSQPIEPVVSGGHHTWSMRGLPALPDEPLSPSPVSTGPWLGVDFRRPAGLAGTNMSWTYDGWSSVSERYEPHYAAAAAADDAIRKRAAALTADTKTRWKTIRALCTFAQGVNYVSVSLDHGSGGGHIPRPASRVLACGYGDCKDKSTLLNSLLRTQGIVSYPVIVYSGDPRHVQESWPSSNQFNHCIVAIEVDESVQEPAVVEHPTLGRLLIFDPTNSIAPAGIVPAEVQGGLGLIVAGSRGGLMRLPTARPEDNRVARRVRARLDASGAIEGTVCEELANNAIVEPRRVLRFTAPILFRELIERWVSESLPAARVSRVEPVDKFPEAGFSLEVDFAAPAHGKRMRDQLIVFKPVLLGRRGTPFLKPGERMSPIVLEAVSFSEFSEIALPPDFVVDEMGEPVEIESPFGRYSSRGSVDVDGKLVFERTFELQPLVLPASEYAGVRDFFARVEQAEQARVVLARKPAS